jgi:hypothetical protein
VRKGPKVALLPSLLYFILKLFLLLRKKSKWQNMSICKCESFLPFNLKNFLPNQSELICRSVLIEFGNGKTISHLQMDIVCSFDFCHKFFKSFISVGKKSFCPKDYISLVLYLKKNNFDKKSYSYKPYWC